MFVVVRIVGNLSDGVMSSVHRFISRVNAELAAALFRTAVARGLAVTGMFVLLAVLGRLYGTAGVGVFALAQSLLMGIVIVCRHGMDAALIKFVGMDPHAETVPIYLRHALTRATAYSICGAVLVFVTRHMWARLFHVDVLADVLIGVAVAGPPLTVAFVCSGFLRGLGMPARSLLLQNGSVAWLSALLVLSLQLQATPHLGMTNIGIALAVASSVVCAGAIGCCWRWIIAPRSKSVSASTNAISSTFGTVANSFFANDLSLLLLQVCGTWIVGVYLTVYDVGLFKVVTQIGRVMEVIASIVNAVFPPKFAAAFHRGNLRQLNRLATGSVLVSAAISVIPFIIAVAWPRWVLRLVGPGFGAAATLLIVFMSIELVGAACGSVSFLLNMTGYEKLERNLAWFAAIAGTLAMVIATPMIGALGAIIGIGIAILTRKLGGVVYVRARLGFWMYRTAAIR